MKKSFFGDVVDFHNKFELPTPENVGVPKMVSYDEFDFRYKFMIEELHEYEEAVRAGDLVKAADALADLVYVALGTAAFHGLPFDEIWDAVHGANMTKIRTPSKEQSKRGSTFDVIKPPDFISPEERIRAIIINHTL